MLKILVAKNNIDTKISNLYSRSKAYATYAQDLADLKSQCESVDRAVKTKVSRLSAEFKQSHGITNSVLENTVNYHLVSFKNTTSAVASAVVSGAALAITVATITAACLSVADALISMYHEVSAYNLAQSDDPATTKRRQEIDKLTDHLNS